MSDQPQACNCEALTKRVVKLTALARALLCQMEEAVPFVGEAAAKTAHPLCVTGEQWLSFRQ